MSRICIDCPSEVKGKGGTGRFRSCSAKHTQSDPEFRERLVAGLRRKKATPEHRAVMKAACRKVHDDRRGDPKWQAYKSASGKRLRAQYDADPEAQRRNAATRAAAGEKVTAHRLAWCPPAYRAEYRRLRKIMPAADARRIIMQQVARDDRARLAALTPLERDLEKLRGGATLVRTFRPTRAGPTITLGGVASGSLTDGEIR